MSEVKFRLLRADEIDVRIGQVGNGWVTLLLYKDARCDQNILDETVGPMNWQRAHSRDNANCVVSIWDDEKCMWISKEDTGTESKTEAEKGLASDSFKRACVNWGIGRELYSGPRIFIRGDVEKLKKEQYMVADIGYTGREITRLAIADKSGVVIYRYGDTDVKTMPMKTPAPQEVNFDALKSASAWCKKVGLKMEDFAKMRDALVAAKIVPDLHVSQMGPEDIDNLCNAIKANYPDALRNF